MQKDSQAILLEEACSYQEVVPRGLKSMYISARASIPSGREASPDAGTALYKIVNIMECNRTCSHGPSLYHTLHFSPAPLSQLTASPS